MKIVKDLPAVFEEFAEQVVPRNLCPLIKSSYGFADTAVLAYQKRNIRK